MASSKDYLNYVLDQLSELDGLSTRRMMGEYLLYYRGVLVGGVYDDRLLLKPTKSALRLVRERGEEPALDIPYDGAKEMLSADIDDGAFCCRVICAVAEDLGAKAGGAP